jgi:hypothetical protein
MEIEPTALAAGLWMPPFEGPAVRGARRSRGPPFEGPEASVYGSGN